MVQGKTPYVSRINQIDAALLDNEIYNILKEQTHKVAENFPPGQLDRWQPEIDAALRFVIWYYSLKKDNATFGQQLLDLKYKDTDRGKIGWYLILSILPKYVQENILYGRIKLFYLQKPKLKLYIEHLIALFDLLGLINLITFLNVGNQPRLIERILGMSNQTATIHKPRYIGYSFMTRELLWHGLIELFGMGIPLINVHYMKQALSRFWLRREQKGILKAFPTMTVHTKCAYCNETPILPVHAGCEHIFCYYCLKAHFTAMTMFHCPKCDTELHVKDMQRYVATNISKTDNVDLSI